MIDPTFDDMKAYPYDYDPIVTQHSHSRLEFGGIDAGAHLHLDLYLPSEAMTADLVNAFTGNIVARNELRARIGEHVALAVREWKDAQPNV